MMFCFLSTSSLIRSDQPLGRSDPAILAPLRLDGPADDRVVMLLLCSLVFGHVPLGVRVWVSGQSHLAAGLVDSANNFNTSRRRTRGLAPGTSLAESRPASISLRRVVGEIPRACRAFDRMIQASCVVASGMLAAFDPCGGTRTY